jgi:ribosomal protein S18 acetylase RimI-like enzyme
VTYLVLHPQLPHNRYASVWGLLCECDKEFVPPLSTRASFLHVGTQSEIQPVDSKPDSYFREMKQQYFLLAEVGSTVVGFMSFQRNYACPELETVAPCNYVTTLCVQREWRRNGIAESFYNFMLHSLDRNISLPYVATRTWSTNTGHINLLDRLGFETVTRLPNHRGCGIDTTYYAKRTS